MELFSSLDAYFYTFLITCFAALPVFYLYLTWNFNYWKKRGIPGRKPRLFMGTFTPPWIQSLDKQDLDCFRKFGRTHGGFDGRWPVLFTSDPKIIRSVFVKDSNAFPNWRDFPGANKIKFARLMITSLKDDEWKLLRHIMTPAYTSGKLKQMVCLIEECVCNLIQSINLKVDNDESIEMTEYFTILSLEIIASCAFGVKIDDIKNNAQSEFVKRARKIFWPSPTMTYLMLIFPTIFDYLPFAVLPDPFSYFAQVANKAIDMRLLNKEGKLTYETIVGMQYLDMVISETFRHLILGYRLERICDRDGYKVIGVALDRGTLLSIPLFPLYNDPEFYPINPEVFDPERFSAENKAKRNPFTFIPFGVGPKNCIAMRFALLELKITLIHLLSKFRFQTEVPTKYSYSPILRVPVSINLKLQKRTDNNINSLRGVDE